MASLHHQMKNTVKIAVQVHKLPPNKWLSYLQSEKTIVSCEALQKSLVLDNRTDEDRSTVTREGNRKSKDDCDEFAFSLSYE
eukprot:snap_masked-scaffold_15-processed-gene-2.60-mRNA-1 protein AED:1.00 eAED:1.00 QI:0/-1/0/0/-1/1/1/0/81